MFKTTIFSILTLFSYQFLSAQAVTVPFDDRWEFSGEHKIEEYKGEQSLYLDNARAVLPDVQFKNGIIEFDIALQQVRGFSGLNFRMQDAKNYEEFYLRAHQSGNPDAMQYTPVFDGLASWQLYYGNGHSTAYTYKFEEWMHVKFIIADDQMEVYIDDMDEPVLHAFQLKGAEEPGYLALYTFLGEVRFANFSYEKIERPVLKSPKKAIPALEPGTVASWQVSTPFAAEKLDGAMEFPKRLAAELKWKPLASEFTGTANLAQVNTRAEGENTVVAKFTVTADAAMVKALNFGYSDVAYVYCNGRLLYSGQRKFRSRDYRYLGTIGYFDTIYLPLQSGENEIWVAVSEQMGGWGVRAKFADTEGVTVQ